ncbi:MAG: hypothetical protein KAI67_02275 [Candidatus Pacebacteria bacterium]|nr:hypothetical protein [Candidatus Paceibacterota bacterium]
MKVIFYKKQKINENGFSLIEIIFSIGIMTVGLMSILSLFTQNIQSGINNRNKLIAIYLAEEQIEMIRNIRDTNWKIDVAGHTWVTGICNIGVCSDVDLVVVVRDIDIDNDYDFTEGCEADRINDAGQNWKKEVFRGADSYYNPRVNGEVLGEKTGFTRWLDVQYCVGAVTSDCLEITSTVAHSGITNVEIKTRLYNWK